MIEIPGRIPLAIHPFFWVFAALIGWLSSQTLTGTFVWIGIILVSVVIHEFGHALTAVWFKQKARIQLIALGGVTTFDGPKLKFWQQFVITFNGPFFGFLLFCLASFLLTFSLPPLLFKILKITQFANLFWTIVNLLPVLPLDGGQLLRIVLEANFGIKGFKAALLFGAGFAAIVALGAFMIQSFLIGAFFFLFAFQSFDSWRKSRLVTSHDREESNKQLMIQAEEALHAGRLDEAKRILEEVKAKATGGLLANTSAQYLAFLAMKEGNKERAYELLLPIRDQLADDSICILHELASEHANYPLVAELSIRCYQIASNQRVALQNARAFAHQQEARSAGGWLQTAWQFGGLDLNSLLQEEGFAKIKESPEFKEFVDGLQ